MKLIKEAGKWHKLWSMRFLLAAGFFAALSEAYTNLPTDWLPYIPGWVKASLGIAGMLCGGASGVARVIRQAGVCDDTGPSK